MALAGITRIVTATPVFFFTSSLSLADSVSKSAERTVTAFVPVAFALVLCRLFRSAWLAVQLDEPLAGQVNPVLSIVYADPSATETLRRLGSGTAAEKTVEYKPARRAGSGDDPIQKRNRFL